MIPLLAFLEACPGIGLLVSGVVLLTVSTILYTEQLATLAQIVPLAFAGACLSDHLGFYLGRWLGDKLHHTGFAKKRASQLQKSERFILKHGASAIVLGRLVPAVRSLVGHKRPKATMSGAASCPPSPPLPLDFGTLPLATPNDIMFLAYRVASFISGSTSWPSR